MGDNLNQIKKWRAKVTLGEIGFAPGFDSDLAGLEQRYLAVYRASFPIMAEGVTKIPDAREWGSRSGQSGRAWRRQCSFGTFSSAGICGGIHS